jgi:hypothetical protein
MIKCINVNLDSWKLLVASRGEHIANYLWEKYDGNVPESESRESVIKSGSIAARISRNEVDALESKYGIKINTSFNTATGISVQKTGENVIKSKQLIDSIKHVLSIKFKDFTDILIEDESSYPLIANLANYYAKTEDYGFYDAKDDLLSYLVRANPNVWSHGDGIVYIETPQGQVSFHVFNDSDEIAKEFGLDPTGRVWSEVEMQFIAEKLLAEYIGDNLYAENLSKSSVLSELDELFERNPRLKTLRNIQYQINNKEVPASKSSPETIKKIREAAKKMGINMQTLEEYLKGNPNVDVKGVNGLADLLQGIVAIAEGKEGQALTEEVIHVATAILEQTNPGLVTEMISKIDKFEIYKRVFDTYKDDPNYQLENGKPDIRKIKKEAVDKLIVELIINENEGSTEFPELMQEVNRSWIRNLWNRILGLFSQAYRKANIDIFQEVASRVAEGNVEGTIEDIDEEGIYLQKVSDKQKEVQDRIQATRDMVVKEYSTEPIDPLLSDTDESNNWYKVKNANGVWDRVTKRVTDRVKAYYKKKFPNRVFTAEEKKFNEFKRTLGVKFHGFFEEIHNRYFFPDGTRKTVLAPRSMKLDVNDEDVYDELEQYYSDLIDKFSRDGKTPLVFSEVIVYDPKEKEAGTLDLLIVEEDGTGNIFDWKFMSVGYNSTDIPRYKQGAYNIQLSRYKDILREDYGVKKIGMNRAVPILMNFAKEDFNDPKSNLLLKGINVGSVDTSQITDLRLVPVSEETETTGNDILDKLIGELNAVLKQVEKEKVTNEKTKGIRSKRIEIIHAAIRQIQGTGEIDPLIDVIRQISNEGQLILNDYNTIYKNASAKDFKDNNKQLSEFAAQLRNYNAIAAVFSKAPQRIGNLIYNKEMEDAAETDEEKEEVARNKEILLNLREQAINIADKMDEIKIVSNNFADKFMGERNLIKGLLSPEAVLKGLGSLFNGIVDLAPASLQILHKLVINATGRASKKAVGEVNELMDIRKRLAERGGDLRQLVQRIYQKDDKGKLVNKLIYKYDKSFYDGVDNNAIEVNQDLDWLKDNIDLVEYKKEAKAHLDESISYIKSRYEYDEDLMEKLIRQEEQKFDIDDDEFNGWNNYIIKRHPLEKWQSSEYKELKKDKDLHDLYTFITKINEKAKDSGYIQNKIASTFLPFVRKSMAESLAWDFSLSSISNWGDSLSLRADDIGYGSVNELTGEIENSVPKYYTQDFTQKEDGTNDYSDVSEDLFKNMILYINHMEKYTEFSEIEDQLLLVKAVESFKNHYNTSTTGKVLLKNGKPEELTGNEENTKMFDDFLRGIFYEQRYPISDGDVALNLSVKNALKKVINKVAGKEVFTVEENPSAISMVKAIDAANRGFQLKTLGFEFISGAVNAFGANIQIATQAGDYFKGREVLKNEGKILANNFSKEEGEMFMQLIEIFMPLKDDPNYEQLNKAGMSTLTQHNLSDWLMVFMRKPEQIIEKSVFLTLLENTMVDNGKIVNIKDYVKKKYPDRNISSARYKETAKQIEEEIANLKKTKSLYATKKLVDGKLVIPGLDLNDIDEVQRLTKLTRRISNNATGTMTQAERNRASMNIWLKSMMVFKGWIPKLLLTRFTNFKKISDDFSVEIDDEGITTGEKYDIGRVRLFAHVLGDGIVAGVRNIKNIIDLNDEGLLRIDEMYKHYAEVYKNKTGNVLTMDKDDFIDLVRTNLRNQVKELAILSSLFGAMLAMGFMAPDDDKDKASKNFYRYSQKVVDKFTSELMFFYNPVEFQNILSGGMFPAIGLLSDFEKFTSHFLMETTGYDITNPSLTPEEVREKALPIKYLAKELPVTKSLITYISLFSSDFAKEYDITIQKQNRR